jgi:hypothetical protein
MRWSWVVAVVVGCSSSEPAGPVDSGALLDGSVDTLVPSDVGPSDAGCSPPLALFWKTPGCDAAPQCLEPQDTACLTQVCGCDGLVHLYGCTGAEAPFRSFTMSVTEGEPCGPDAGDGGGD